MLMRSEGFHDPGGSFAFGCLEDNSALVVHVSTLYSKIFAVVGRYSHSSTAIGLNDESLETIIRCVFVSELERSSLNSIRERGHLQNLAAMFNSNQEASSVTFKIKNLVRSSMPCPNYRFIG